MSKQKKKRDKAYKPKAVLNTIGRRDVLQLELPGLVAMQFLGTENFNDDHLYSLVAHADIARRLTDLGSPERAAAESIIKSAKLVLERLERVGKVGVSRIEQINIREGFAITMPFLQKRTSRDISRACIASGKEFTKKGWVDL